MDKKGFFNRLFGMLMTNFRYSIVTNDKERKELAVLTQYAFFPSPDELKRNEMFFDYNKDSYILSVYDEDYPEKPIATASSIPMTQNLRGKIFLMDGITNVATEPSYRRQHITAGMMQKIFDHDKEAGLPVSCLYPFKESFYAKFGYITLPQARIVTLNLQNLSPLLGDKTPFKSSKLNFKDNFSIYYEFLKENQKYIHGMALKGLNSLKMVPEIRPAHLLFVYDEKNNIIGSLVYSTKGKGSDILVSSFFYLNSYGKYLLFKYLVLHIDQFSFVKFPISPVDHPENWFNDLRLQINTREWEPSAMARIINVEGLSELPVGEGSIVIRITDPDCSWNNGTFKLISVSEKLVIERGISGSDCECELTIQGLTAFIYGNYILEDLLLKKWLKEYKKGSIKKLESLFPYSLPYIFDTL